MKYKKHITAIGAFLRSLGVGFFEISAAGLILAIPQVLFLGLLYYSPEIASMVAIMLLLAWKYLSKLLLRKFFRATT